MDKRQSSRLQEKDPVDYREKRPYKKKSEKSDSNNPEDSEPSEEENVTATDDEEPLEEPLEASNQSRFQTPSPTRPDLSLDNPQGNVLDEATPGPENVETPVISTPSEAQRILIHEFYRFNTARLEIENELKRLTDLVETTEKLIQQQKQLTTDPPLRYIFILTQRQRQLNSCKEKVRELERKRTEHYNSAFLSLGVNRVDDIRRIFESASITSLNDVVQAIEKAKSYSLGRIVSRPDDPEFEPSPYEPPTAQRQLFHDTSHTSEESNPAPRSSSPLIQGEIEHSSENNTPRFNEGSLFSNVSVVEKPSIDLPPINQFELSPSLVEELDLLEGDLSFGRLRFENSDESFSSAKSNIQHTPHSSNSEKSNISFSDTMDALSVLKIEPGDIYVPKIILWFQIQGKGDLPNFITKYAEYLSKKDLVDTNIGTKRDQTVKMMRTIFGKLDNELQNDEDVDKIFVLLQKILRLVWTETSQTILCRQRNMEEPQILADQAARAEIYKSIMPKINEAQTLLSAYGYKQAVFGDTMDIPSSDCMLTLRKQAISEGYVVSPGQNLDAESGDSAFQSQIATVFKDLRDMQIDHGQKIELPTFSGGATKWYLFWHQFKLLVDQNKRMSTITKFNKLKTHLSGEPLSLINGFKFNEENYEKVKTALVSKYGDDTIVSSELFRDLFATKKINGDNPDEFRSFTNKAKQAVDYALEYIPSQINNAPHLLGSFVQKISDQNIAKWHSFIKQKKENATPSQKIELEKSQVPFFIEWLEIRTKELEEVKRSKVGMFDLVSTSTPRRESSSISRGRGNYRGGFSGNRFYQNSAKDESINYAAQEQKPSFPPSNQNPNLRGRGRGNGRGRGITRGASVTSRGRGRGNGNVGRGQSLPKSTPSLSVIRTPQVGRGKATVFPNDIRNRMCIICSKSIHQTIKCPALDHYQSHELFQIIKRQDVCTNCYRFGHDAINCNQPPSCSVCHGYHTTHLHTIWDGVKNANKQGTPNQGNQQQKQ